MKTVATFLNYVATKVQDNQEKFVAIIKSMSQQRACRLPKSKVAHFHDNSQLYHDIKCEESKEGCRDILKLCRDLVKAEEQKECSDFRNFVVKKDKANGNRTLSRHPKLYCDMEFKEVLERMS